MDYNNYLKISMLHIGHFDFYSKKIKLEQWRLKLNYFCATVCFICGLKSFLILIMSDEKAYFYLIELYIIKSFTQTVFHTGVMCLHFGNCFAYLYWANLCKDVNRIKCFNMFFIPDLKDLCNYYDLDLEPTQNFIKKANLIRISVDFLMYSFDLFFGLFLTRCLILSFYNLEYNYFLFISLPFAVITFFSFHCLTFASLTIYTLFFTTQEFLILRAFVLSQKIRNLNESSKASNEDTFQIMNSINKIIIQFSQSNRIFDKTL